MPELPEVETIARKLNPVLSGHWVVKTDILWGRTVACPDLDAFREHLIGAQIQSVTRRGKYIVMSLDTGWTLLVHLRMSGKFVVRDLNKGPGDNPYVRLRFQLDNGIWVLFVNPRKFGRFYLVKDMEEVTAKLGPEPLDHKFTSEILASRLAGRRGEIKRLLLDQGFVAGLGNIYASEALWKACIHPQRTADTLTSEEVTHLHTAIVECLKDAVQNGGTSLDDRQYVYPDGGLGQHQVYLAVYDREGDVCPRCGYEIQRMVQGQRSTYFCPVCQPTHRENKRIIVAKEVN